MVVVSNRSGQGNMERFIFGFGAAAMTVLGGLMVIWPRWIIVQSRDADDRRPVSNGEALATRIAGVGVAIVSAYGLYAIIARLPGGDVGAP
jgi:hypothetical protein